MIKLKPLLASVFKPLLAAVLFLAVTLTFSYIINTNSQVMLFLSSPFNINSESALINLYAPAIMIFLVAVYLKNFNSAFARKCSLRAVFVIAVAASYLKSFIGMFYYNGGISTGTSIITLAFIVTLLMSLEVLVRDKQRYEYHYSKFLIRFLTADITLAMALTIYSFFIGSSALVHLIGILVFSFIFTLYYERVNIERFYNKETRELVTFILTEEHRYSASHSLHKIAYRNHNYY